MNWLKKLIVDWLNKWAKASTPKPQVTLPPNAQPEAAGCDCDLVLPLVDPPWSGSELAAMGNGAECPTWAGMDVRLKCTYPVQNGGKTWLLGQLLKDAMGQRDGKLFCRCFTRDGVRYHFLGYSYNSAPMTPCKSGELFDYKTTTFVWFEARKS